MAWESKREAARDEDAILAALLKIHRAKTERTREAGAGGSYARILEHFERRGQRLAGEKLMTAEFVERLFEGGKALPRGGPQQELEIAGVTGGAAAGRFRVTNRSSARARFSFVVGDPVDGRARPEVSFDPPEGELEPGQTRLVRVAASLSGWRSGEAVTVPVECRWPEGRDRLWLIVSASADVDVDVRP
jgi:hypothetical protein